VVGVGVGVGWAGTGAAADVAGVRTASEVVPAAARWPEEPGHPAASRDSTTNAEAALVTSPVGRCTLRLLAILAVSMMSRRDLADPSARPEAETASKHDAFGIRSAGGL
jgi:hypothetical protein